MSTPSPRPSPFEGEGAKEPQRPIGEVVQASTSEYLTQCHRLYDASPLGSLVKSGGDSPIYGVVDQVTTQSIDPGRRPTAVGERETTVEEVYKSNPQLNRLLSTGFRSIVVGHRADDQLRRYLAPLPPKIHELVYRCESAEVLEFSASLVFMPLLLAAPSSAPDEVIASFLRQASLSHPDPRGFLVHAGRELASLLAEQLQRLNGLLRRLSS